MRVLMPGVAGAAQEVSCGGGAAAQRWHCWLPRSSLLFPVLQLYLM